MSPTDREIWERKQEKSIRRLQLVTGIGFPLYALVLATLRLLVGRADRFPPNRRADPELATLYANAVTPSAEISRAARNGRNSSLYEAFDKLTAGFAAIDPLLSDSGRVQVSATIDSLEKAAEALVALPDKSKNGPARASLDSTVRRLGHSMSLVVRADLFPRDRRQ